MNSDEPKYDGEVPEGWESVRLNQGIVTDVQSGFACGANNRDGDGVPHLRPMNVDVGGEYRLQM